MKQSISPGVAAALVAVVVVIVLFIGYKVFVPQKDNTTPPPEARQAMEQQTNTMKQMYSHGAGPNNGQGSHPVTNGQGQRPPGM